MTTNVSVTIRDNGLHEWLKGIKERFSDHLEMYAAAYLKETDIPPSEAVMVVTTTYKDRKIIQEITFKRKQESDHERRPE